MQPLAGCIHYSVTFIAVIVSYGRVFILVISRMVRIPALLLGVLRAQIVWVRTLFKRLYTVRVPAIVRMKSRGVNTQLHNFYRRSFARVLYFVLMKD